MLFITCDDAFYINHCHYRIPTSRDLEVHMKSQKSIKYSVEHYCL